MTLTNGPELGILVWQDFMFGCGQVNGAVPLVWNRDLLIRCRRVVPSLRFVHEVRRGRGRAEREEAPTPSVHRDLW